MIHSPESSVKFTDEQERQQHTHRIQLANIQNETVIATSHLKQLKEDGLKTSKENAYQHELFAATLSQVAEAQAKLDELMAEIPKSAAVLESHRQQHMDMDVHLSLKKEEHDAREKALGEADAVHAAREEEFTLKSKKLSDDQLLVEQAKEAFLKATESVSWK